MMPPHFTREPPSGPLATNEFRVEGYTLAISDWSVHDETADAPCAVEVEIETTTEVAERWKDAGELPPGAVQERSVVRVRFRPAVPGHRYRLDGPADSLTREYQGPAIQ